MDDFNVMGATWSDLAAWAILTAPAMLILGLEWVVGRPLCQW